MQTHNTEITSSLVAIPVEDGEISAFVAHPASDTPRGAVIVVHEIFGLTDHIKDVAARVARGGYTALAPDLFTREGALPLNQGFEAIRAIVGGIPDSRIASDLNACTTWLRNLNGSTGKVGLVGFCWGGRVAMLMAGSNSNLQACVAYYGRTEGEKSDAQPLHPIDIVASISSPLMGHFGGRDGAIPVDGVHRLEAALTAAGKPSEIYIYEDAGHAFNNDTREQAFNAEAAALAMQRSMDWFGRYLN